MVIYEFDDDDDGHSHLWYILLMTNPFYYYFDVQGLVQGNVTQDEAIKMYELVKASLLDKGVSDGDFVTEIRCNEVPDGHHFLRINGVNPKDTNTLVTNYYQSSHASTLENHMLMEVALMIMEEPVFDILRTKEQLGYSVFSMLRNTHGILGISVTVNSQVSVHEINISNNFFTFFLTGNVGFQV